MSLSSEQLAIRRAGITATDIGALAGVHPYRKPVDVWLDKTGNAAPFDGNARSRWGEILEEPIRTDYENRHNVAVQIPGTLTRDGWMLATPDGIVFPVGAREPDRGMEMKVHSRDAVYFGGLEYGVPGTDEVPAHELCQCAWGMAVTGLPRWDLIVFLDGAPVEYTIERDDELIGMLTDTALKFRRDHIGTGVPPEPDGSSSYARWQKRKWGKAELSEEPIVLDLDHPLRDTIIQLREARARIAEFETIADRHAQTIKEVMGTKTIITWQDERNKPSKITWKRNRSGSETDWEAVARECRSSAAFVLQVHDKELDRALILAQEFGGDEACQELATAINNVKAALGAIASDSIAKDHTKITDGNRPFNVPRHWAKSDKKES